QSYTRTVLQVLARVGNYFFAACKTLFDLDTVSDLAADRYRLRLHSSVAQHKYRSLPVSLLNCRFRHPDSRRLSFRVRFSLLNKSYLGVHIRQDSGIDVYESHLYFDCSFLTVRRRDDLPYFGRQLFVWQRIERDFGREPGSYLSDARFIYVGFDFKRV